MEEEVAVDEEEEEERQVEKQQVEERRRSMNMRNKGTGTVSKTEEIWVESFIAWQISFLNNK